MTKSADEDHTLCMEEHSLSSLLSDVINTTKSWLTDIQIEGIDLVKGIAMTGGNDDDYLLFLKSYYELVCEKLVQLEDCIREGDLELYRIHVHALKSTSASIGAIELSKAAKALELAADKKDLTFIKANHSEFLKDLKTLSSNIYPIIMDKFDNQAMNIALKSTLTQLKMAMVEGSLDAIDQYAKILQKHLLTAEIDDVVNEILLNKMIGEYDEAVRLIDTILDKM